MKVILGKEKSDVIIVGALRRAEALGEESTPAGDGVFLEEELAAALGRVVFRHGNEGESGKGGAQRAAKAGAAGASTNDNLLGLWVVNHRIGDLGDKPIGLDDAHQTREDRFRTGDDRQAALLGSGIDRDHCLSKEGFWDLQSRGIRPVKTSI
jgi:hypothetical protein